MSAGTRVAALVLLSAAALGGCTRTDSSSPSPGGQAGIIPTAAAAPGEKIVGDKKEGAPIRFIGRFDMTDPKAPRFAWSGSAIATRFHGTGMTVRLKEETGKNHFHVILDGEPKSVVKLDPKNETYLLAKDLPEGPHDLVLYKRTEARAGEVAFLGFEPQGPNAKLLPVPPAPDRRIEFIGDSITTGFGIEGPGPACGYNPHEQNEYMTYAGISARELKADHVTLAWSGKTILEMTEMWDRVLPGRPDSKWDFQKWTPHAVVLNIGTNNFALADPGEERFVRLYTQLVGRVRKTYPDAFIVCILGPMLTDIYPENHHNLTQAKKYMKVAVAKLKADDKKLEYLELAEQKHSDGLGCGYHPGPKTQKMNAERLTALLKEKLGW